MTSRAEIGFFGSPSSSGPTKAQNWMISASPWAAAWDWLSLPTTPVISMSWPSQNFACRSNSEATSPSGNEPDRVAESIPHRIAAAADARGGGGEVEPAAGAHGAAAVLVGILEQVVERTSTGSPNCAS